MTGEYDPTELHDGIDPDDRKFLNDMNRRPLWEYHEQSFWDRYIEVQA